jgi:hypothetical protein
MKSNGKEEKKKKSIETNNNEKQNQLFYKDNFQSKNWNQKFRAENTENSKKRL